MSKKKSTRTPYNVPELTIRDGSEAEQIRTRAIFEDLKGIADRGGLLTEHEKNFFCNGLILSTLNDGKIEAYRCCDNFKFKELYLTYFFDLTGGSKYVKLTRNARKYYVKPAEADKDLKYLLDAAEEWDILIQKDSPDPLLLQAIVEARQDLKNLDAQPEVLADPFAKGKFRYRYKRWAILLHFRWIYCFGLEFFEAADTIDLELELNGIKIEFNEYSLVHILNRHFSQISKQFEKGKSFHSEDIIPRLLGSQLKQLIKEIDDSQLLKNKPIKQICFKYKNVDYHLWTEKKTKSVAGKGNITFTRLQTFYPVVDATEIGKLKTNYTLKKVHDGLEIYVPV